MDKFQDKYRIPSARLRNWDYGWNASYFVTICTANRECCFGEIRNDQMQFSTIGSKVNEYWLEIPEHFPFVKLDLHVVMPNHVHGIIVIGKPDDGQNDKCNTGQNDERNVCGNLGRKAGRDVKTPNLGDFTPHPPQTAAASQKWKPETLGTIINQYKRICTIESRKINPDFAWQTRFYDHIIRNDSSYQRIRNYIINNPKNWEKDALFNNNPI